MLKNQNKRVYNNVQIMYQKWQGALFQQLITQIFSKINDQSITWFQFNLILKQASIKFRTLSQQLKFRKYFQQNQIITKDNLKYLLMLNETMISNNKRFYIVKMKQSIQTLIHKPNKCFQWWKQWMTKKYGPDIKWFDIICMQKDCFKIKAFDFKQNIAKILKQTEHSKCFINIAAFFPKTQHNQIQFSIFMNTIKVSIKPKYINSFSTGKQLSKFSQPKSLKSKSKFNASSNSKQKYERAMTQTSQTFYIADWYWQMEDKNQKQKQPQYYVKGKILKKNVSKSIATYYSVPVKQFNHKQHKNNRYQTWMFQKQKN